MLLYLKIWLPLLLGVLFVINGAVNLIGPKGLREDVRRWKLPAWSLWFNGIVQILIGASLFAPATQWVGLVGGFAVCAGVYLVLWKAGELSHAVPVTVLALLLIAAEVL